MLSARKAPKRSTGTSPKCNYLFLSPLSAFPKNVIKICSDLFKLLPGNKQKQTNTQNNAGKNIFLVKAIIKTSRKREQTIVIVVGAVKAGGDAETRWLSKDAFAITQSKTHQDGKTEIKAPTVPERDEKQRRDRRSQPWTYWIQQWVQADVQQPSKLGFLLSR